MPRTPHIAEDHNSRTLTGSAVLSRIKLTGWGALSGGVPALESETDRGRLWWKFTQSSNLLELFMRPTMSIANSERVAYDAGVADGKATLVQDNASGISGSCDIDEDSAGANPGADATGDLIVCYAHENDVLSKYAAADGYLDENDKYDGRGTRFEALLLDAKQELDEELTVKLLDNLEDYVATDEKDAIKALLGGFGRDAKGRRLLAMIADPRQLARVHALYCASILEARRVGESESRADISQWHLDRANKMLRGMNIALDIDADGDVDVERRGVDRRLKRT